MTPTAAEAPLARTVGSKFGLCVGALWHFCLQICRVSSIIAWSGPSLGLAVFCRVLAPLIAFRRARSFRGYNLAVARQTPGVWSRLSLGCVVRTKFGACPNLVLPLTRCRLTMAGARIAAGGEGQPKIHCHSLAAPARKASVDIPATQRSLLRTSDRR